MRYFIVLISVLLVSACSETQEETTEKQETKSCCHHKQGQTTCETYIDSLKANIMEVHDEVMPQTGHLVKLILSLEEKIKSDSIQGVTLQPTVDSLELAHDEMMNWMNDYKASHEVSDTIYFLEQKEKIDRVNFLYKQTIKSAEQKLQ